VEAMRAGMRMIASGIGWGRRRRPAGLGNRR
jgi:hypothetical protein